MATPESVRADLNLPEDLAPGTAMVEIVFRDMRVKDFHHRAGIKIVAALEAENRDMDSLLHYVSFQCNDSPYETAIYRICDAENAGQLPEGSTNEAFALLQYGLFDATKYVEYLPEH
jgi:hypothetical protein